MKITAPPAHIVFLLNRLAAEGFDGYVVGGSVRDSVMGRPVRDWDLATSAAPVDVARLFPKTVLTGERFGTVTVVLPECSVEVTTFRTESEYTDGRHPGEVEFVSNLEEDLARRDFTMNAMAESVDGELIDPFGGIDDITNGIIKCVGGPNTRFTEDALRMFRALRFSAELGFNIEKETLQAIYANTGLADRISSERVRLELEKTLMSRRPEVDGEMIKIGLLGRFVAVSGKSHDDFKKIVYLPEDPVIRWCVFCGILVGRQYIKSASELLHNMHLDGKTIKTCVRALEIQEFPADRIEIKRLLSKHGDIVVRCAAAVNEVLDETGQGDRPPVLLELTDSVIRSGECITLGGLAVCGRDLLAAGHLPGQKIGETLNKLLDHVIVNPGDNNRETLMKLACKE